MVAALSDATGSFAKLVEDGSVGKVTLAFEEAIADSFMPGTNAHAQRHMTAAEVKRRFEICCTIFVKLRGDLKWGIDRILGHIPEYLRAELNGIAWTPDTRSCWMPEDG